MKGICSKGLFKKSTYSCDNNVVVKFHSLKFNSFVVKVSAINDTDTFVKPRECKIGTNQLTNQLIPRNWDKAHCPIKMEMSLDFLFYLHPCQARLVAQQSEIGVIQNQESLEEQMWRPVLILGLFVLLVKHVEAPSSAGIML